MTDYLHILLSEDNEVVKTKKTSNRDHVTFYTTDIMGKSLLRTVFSKVLPFVKESKPVIVDRSIAIGDNFQNVEGFNLSQKYDVRYVSQLKVKS